MHDRDSAVVGDVAVEEELAVQIAVPQVEHLADGADHNAPGVVLSQVIRIEQTVKHAAVQHHEGAGEGALCVDSPAEEGAAEAVEVELRAGAEERLRDRAIMIEDHGVQVLGQFPEQELDQIVAGDIHLQGITLFKLEASRLHVLPGVEGIQDETRGAGVAEPAERALVDVKSDRPGIIPPGRCPRSRDDVGGGRPGGPWREPDSSQRE